MLKLTAEQLVLLILIRENNITVDLKTIDWDSVKKEAIQQSVFLQAANSLTLPGSVKASWKNVSLLHAANNIHSMKAVMETDQIMREHGVPYVILKGLSSASYYPEFPLRALGDCDFLIEASRKDEVMQILRQEGYEEGNEVRSNHHVVFRKGRYELEMHFTIPGMPDGGLENVVRTYIADILTDTDQVELQGRSICVPSSKNHGVILLLHMQHHMLAEGIGIRHLLDWCYFVEKTDGEEFWEAELLPLLKAIGMLHYAAVMTKVGNVYFGTKCPQWASDVEEELADEVMQDILTGGNFGRKNKARANSGVMITSRNNGTSGSGIGNLWVRFLGGVRGYKPEVLEKYPVLYPVFMIRYLVVREYRVLTGKRRPVFIGAKYVEERKSVYEKLKIFEV